MTEWNHISDHDLERYYLCLVKNKTDLAAMEEHILARGSCAERAAEARTMSMRSVGPHWILWIRMNALTNHAGPGCLLREGEAFEGVEVS